MEIKVAKSDWLFLIICLGLGILAEEAFFRSEIGISFIVFISAFYAVFFWRYRKFTFSHQRLGYLIVCCIWLLAVSYFLNDNLLFYLLNMLVIPGLVIFHLVLVTSPKNLKWNQPTFITFIFSRIVESLKYNGAIGRFLGKHLKQGVNEDKWVIWKKVLIGVAISLPVLFVVLRLLMSADMEFERMIGGIPDWFHVIDAEGFARFMVIVICTLAFFGFLQVLMLKHINKAKQLIKPTGFQMDAIISLTLLVLINMVYILFTVVQFKYFFSGTLQENYTYAEYARKGFFELLFVTMINLSITVVVLTFVKQAGAGMRKLMQIMLTVLVLASSVMLSSAFSRLSMYEDAYGYTFTRVLVHSFMIFLVVIFAYTLVKIWIERLSLFHFYFITTLIYYTAITVVNLDTIVVKENMNRYEDSGKIDVRYLNQLSYTGISGLMELYEKDPNVPELKTLLQERKQESLTTSLPWQSYNLSRQEAFTKLEKLELK